MAEIARHFERIASQSIRNAGSIIGNIILAQKNGFESDIKPVFDLLGANYELQNEAGKQKSSTIIEKSLVLNITIDLPKTGLLTIRKITDRATTSLANLAFIGLHNESGSKVRLYGTKLEHQVTYEFTNPNLQSFKEQLTGLDDGYRNIALGEFHRFLAQINGETIEPLNRTESEITANFDNNGQQENLEETLKNSQKRKEGILHAQGQATYTADVKYRKGEKLSQNYKKANFSIQKVQTTFTWLLYWLINLEV